MTILFGGSFDPPHEGHLHVIRSLLENYSPSRFWIVPAHQNPMKAETAASAADRLAMVELLVKEINDPRVAICALEIERKGPSYTMDTVRALSKESPGDRFAFALGNEIFPALPGWKEARELVTSIDWIVIARQSQKAQFDPRGVLSALGVSDAKNESGRWSYLGGKRWMEICEIEALEVSSSQLKIELARDAEAMPQGIQRSVWRYIKENRTYAVKKDGSSKDPL